MKVLTYGTFDLFHIGHLNLLQRLREMGDELIVGVSTDEFNQKKGKRAVASFNDRVRILSELKCVDGVIAEHDWNQKKFDILNHEISIFGMGDDWIGKFDELNLYCKVVYLPRTEGVSTTDIKKTIKTL